MAGPVGAPPPTPLFRPVRLLGKRWVLRVFVLGKALIRSESVCDEEH